MADVASCDANIQKAVLEALSEGLAAAMFICDRNDLIVFASASVRGFFPVPHAVLEAGTRLRDFLGAVYDVGGALGIDAPAERTGGGREGWLSARIARHWKERSDSVERFGNDRWLRIVTRRLPSGYGVCLLRDVSEETKRENQWRLDLERVQLTEEILDSLPFPISVKDRNLAYAAVNRAMCGLLDRAPENILGRTDGEIQPSETAGILELSDRRVLDTGGPLALPEHKRGADGEEVLLLTQKWRVGKPGRYMLVTAVQNVTGLAENSGLEGYAPLAGGKARDNGGGQSLPASAAGSRILLATGDAALEARALKALARLGFDSCSVRNGRELAAFLEVAASANVRIDLVVLDSDMDMSCLETVERHGVEALPLDGWQIANELAFSLARALNARKLRARPGGEEVLTLTTDAKRPDAAQASLDVLVAEDNDINRIVFSQILEGLGYSYLIAGTGAEVLRLWREHGPRIVFMDTTLPDMPGGEAARLIRREEEAVGGRVPIIGVLARAVDGDREACLADGMDEVILKPISPDMVEGAVRRLLGEAQAAAAL